jgi:uncharacterized protein
MMETPGATKAALVATLAVTVTAVIAFVLAAPPAEVEPRLAGWFLLLFSSLFLLRVAGQVLVALRQPEWLPPMRQWNLTPYALLLPTQVAFLGAMAWLLYDFLVASGTATSPAPAFGRFVLAFSVVYSTAMGIRLVVRMRRRPEERWFGGTIPIVFHWVLAAFLFVFGSYHASY